MAHFVAHFPDYQGESNVHARKILQSILPIQRNKRLNGVLKGQKLLVFQ